MKTIEASDTIPDIHSDIASYEKVSFWQRIGLGFGGIPDMGLQYAVMSMANPIFNICLGVNPVLIGIAMSLPRFWEMILDPWIGGRSDRTRGPLGRRHPYILTGGILGGLLFAAIWWVPHSWSAEQKGIWLIVMALLHFTAYSIFMVPYSALLAEVSHVPAERTRIMATRTAFTALASCGISWLYWICQRPIFSNPADGMRVVGIAFGGVMALAAIMPTMVCRRSRLFQPSPAQVREVRETKVIGEILRIKEFRYIIFAVLSLLASFTLVSNLSIYINIYYVFGGDKVSASVFQGVAGLIVCGTSIATCSLVSYTSKIFGRSRTLKFFMLMTLIGKITSWWSYNREWPYASVVSIVLINMGVTAFWIFMPSLIGEISNRHESRTGRSLYGSFSAVYGVSMKIAASISLLLTGFILNFTRFDAALGNAQTARTLTEIRLLNIIIPVAGLLIAMYFLRRVWVDNGPVKSPVG